MESEIFTARGYLLYSKKDLTEAKNMLEEAISISTNDK